MCVMPSTKSIHVSRMSTSLVGAKTGDVQELAIGRRMKKDAFAAIIEGVLKEHGKEDAEGCWCKYTALFHSAADLKSLGG